ncbi:hypothetical protein BGY98DRAFT_915201, partial [Russula aff. rugulosa BPL654]
SVSKWIHFNGGDPGLKRFFECACDISTRRHFVLEAQPRESYCTSRPASYNPCVLFTLL